MFDKRIKVCLGNDVPLKVRLRTSNGTEHYDIRPADVTVQKVLVGRQREDKASQISFEMEDNYVVFTISKTKLDKIGLYSVWIKAVYRDNDSTLAFGESIEVVPFSQMSSIDHAIISDFPEIDPKYEKHLHHHNHHIEGLHFGSAETEYLPFEQIHHGHNCHEHRGDKNIFEWEGLFIPVEYTDEEITQLKGDLRDAIAENEASKAALDAAKLAIDDIVTNAKIDSAVSTIKTKINAAVTELKSAIAAIDPYVELTNDELDAIVSDEEPVHRAKITAYNEDMDATITLLRKVEVIEDETDKATWYDEDNTDDLYYTALNYSIGGNVQILNSSDEYINWGVITEIIVPESESDSES